MTNRNLRLDNDPVEEALAKYLSALTKAAKPEAAQCFTPKFDEVPTEESLGRVTSKAVYARFNSPHYNGAAMDGIAVKASSTTGASESSPVTLKPGKDFIPVNTGNPVNEPYDAVIMAEDLIHVDGEQSVKITQSASVMQHIRPVGENFRAGDMLIAEKHKIRPIDIGVLVSGGIDRVQVYARPKVAIFPTGSEIIDLSQLNKNETPKEGAIIESNSRMYEAQVRQAGGEPFRFAPVPDDYELLKNAIRQAAQDYDVVIINAGSSAGTEDYTVNALRGIGEVIVHGVAMKPGKPVILAIVNNKPVIGTPGYPVSAYISFETFIIPVLSILTGCEIKPRQKINAVLSKQISSSVDRREYVRVKLENANGKLTAFPLARHSGVAMSLVQADGFCVIDQGCAGYDEGEIVVIEFLD